MGGHGSTQPWPRRGELGRQGDGPVSNDDSHAGLSELKVAAPPAGGRSERARVRSVGGGRKKLIDKDASLLGALDALVEPTTRGDPRSALRWTCKSTHRLAEQLRRQGHQVSQRSVCELLTQAGFSLQSTRKTREGAQHEDRDTQFMHIARTVAEYQAAGDPVISVDTQEEGADRRLQECGPRVAAQGQAGACAGA
jgi:transposase